VYLFASAVKKAVGRRNERALVSSATGHGRAWLEGELRAIENAMREKFLGKVTESTTAVRRIRKRRR